MSYVALKDMILSGNKYLKGDAIDPAHILPKRKRALLRNGCIAEVADLVETEAVELNAEGWEGEEILVPIPLPDDENGNTQGMTILMLLEDILKAIKIMQTTPVEDAARAVEEIRKEEILILLDSADSRQGVKKAAKKQAAKLEEETEKEAEQSEG